MINRKLIVIISACIVVLTGAGIAGYLLTRPKPVKTPTPNYSVKTEGLSNVPSELSPSFIKLVESSVDRVVVDRHGAGTYHATYRDGSFHRMVYPSGAISTTLLVDVAETKETYEFTKTGTDSATASTSYIRCAPADQQLVHPSVCKDPAEGY